MQLPRVLLGLAVLELGEKAVLVSEEQVVKKVLPFSFFDVIPLAI